MKNKFYILELNTRQTQAKESQYLKDIGIRSVPVKGCYKGERNDAHVVVGSHDYIMFIARMFKQESVLAVDEHNGARLFYLDSDEIKFIGIFEKVDESEALSQDAWTLIDKEYFICK